MVPQRSCADSSAQRNGSSPRVRRGLGDPSTVKRVSSRALQRRLQALGIPCWTGAPVGHGIRNHAFIWGESVRCQGGHMELSGVMA